MARLSIQELAAILMEKNGLEKEEAQRFVTAVFEVIQTGVEKDKLVKVKGLGTFKIIDVDARESVNVNTGDRVLIDSHSKITFTPDATMKELVNKPFSGFETVVLNEGVEFEDTPVQEESDKDDDTDEEPQILEFVVEDKPATDEVIAPVSEEQKKTIESAVAEEPINPQQPFIEEMSSDKEEPVDEEKSTVEEESVVEEKSTVEEESNANEGPIVETATEPANDTVEEIEEEQSSRWWVWILVILFSLSIGFASGLYVGENGIISYASLSNDKQEPIVTDSIEETAVPDTTIVAQATDSLTTDTLTISSQKEESAKKEEQVAKTEKTEKAEEPEYKKYEAMDSRVRTGAYYIIGLDKEVEVRKGDNVERISRRYLGEEMSCYVEVYNNFTSKTELKAGQKVRIPKLKLKKLMRD